MSFAQSFKAVKEIQGISNYKINISELLGTDQKEKSPPAYTDEDMRISKIQKATG